MSGSTESSPFPNARRVITGHTPTGASTVLVDDRVEPFKLVPQAKSLFSNVYRTEDEPPSNAAGLGKDIYTDAETSKHVIVGDKGSVMWVTDTAPRTQALFHRTLSLDYGIVMKGSIVLTLDNNERVTLNEGDIIVQRGTIHGWENETDEWTRMYFVMLASKKVEVDGKELGAEFPA